MPVTTNPAKPENLAARSKARSGGRLRNGVGPGSIARVYRQHQMRFARVTEVVTGFGIGPNVTVKYLDFDQETGQVFGSVVQPVTAGWIHDMKERFAAIKDIFEPSENGPVAARAASTRQLRNGVTEGSLIRIYRDHHMRFGRVLQLARVSLPSMPNVTVEYLDGDREEAKIFGNVVQPVTQDWVQDLEARMDAISKLMASERAIQLNAQLS
jgi:hypothetical protein